jgi:hypothetical protein
MRKKTLSLLAFLVFWSWTSELLAQNLVIKLNNGTQNSELLNTLQKLSFESGNMIVSFKTGSTDSYNLAEIQKLYFGLETSVAELPLQADTKLSISPNPVSEMARIQNIPEGTSELKIYRMDGKLVMQSSAILENGTLNLGNLPSGIYLLIAKNQSLKFIKI